MLTFEIPGRDPISVDHLVLDYNGTIAVDGKLIEGVEEKLALLKNNLNIHVLTADTYGTVRQQCEPLGLNIHTFPNDRAGDCKREIVSSLDGGCCCIGNGYNDQKMFDIADLSICVIEAEGICAMLLEHATVFTLGINDALDLLLKPKRLKATLRN
ncbi:MAG: ATPase P [Mogibacterium sp.]|nr:ATPase P [Mogibacterium sp.]